MNNNLNDILTKIKNKKIRVYQRKFITKVLYRLKLIIAQILSNVFTNIYIFLFVADNK